MRTKTHSIVVGAVAVALVLVLVAASRPVTRQEAVTWEYKVTGLNHAEFDRKANELGAEGWELVAATDTVENSTHRSLQYFKRRK